MSNYSKGSNFERTTKKQLESKGYFVIRSAGSKGKIDLCAVPLEGPIEFIQCKLHGVISKKERESLIALAERYGAKPLIAQKAKAGVTFLDLTEDS